MTSRWRYRDSGSPSTLRRGVLGALAIALACGVALASQQKPDRSAPPVPGDAPSLRLPPVAKLKLSNGLSVWLVEQHEVPLAQVNLIVRAGGGADPADKYGVASMTADMLDEGAGSRSALELADAIEFLGAQLTTTSSFDYSAVRLSVPVARLDDALPLMADVVLRPTFPSQELERLRKERLTRLLQARDDPAAIVELAFPRIVYGPKHRYGTPSGGLTAEVEALTLDDTRAFHRAYYRPELAALVVVGDVTAETVMPLLEGAFGGWKGEGELVRPHDVLAAPQLNRRRTYIVDKPGAAQSQVRIGWVGVARTTADYPALRVMNTILGGAFTSRLNTNLRETHGYSYGAFSRFEERISTGPFYATAGVQTDKTSEALREFFRELTGIQRPVPQEELDKARNYVALGFPSQFETTGDLARKLEEQLVYGLPDDYYSTYIASVGQVTARDVQNAASRYIQPDKFAVVVVGDRQAIERGIRGLNLGPVEVLSVEQAIGESGGARD